MTHPLHGRITPALRLLLTPFLALFLTGCPASTQGGKDLSAAGVNAANGLADYYDQLADYALDVPELDAVNTGLMTLLAGPNRAQGERKIKDTTEGYTRIADALRRRAAMARNLAALYASIGSLAAYDARAAVGGAAENLSKSVTALPAVSEKLDANPSNLVNLIAGDVAALKQAGDLRKASDLTANVLERVVQFVQEERGGGGGEGADAASVIQDPIDASAPAPAAPTTAPATPPTATPSAKVDLYAQVINRRASLLGQVSQRLINKGYVDGAAVLKGVGDDYQLPWDGRVKDDDKSTAAAAGVIAAAQARRQAALTTAAGNDVVQALRLLVAQHRNFAQTGAFDPANAQALVQRAQVYIDEIEKLKKEARETRAVRREEERKKNAATKPSNG